MKKVKSHKIVKMHKTLKNARERKEINVLLICKLYKRQDKCKRPEVLYEEITEDLDGSTGVQCYELLTMSSAELSALMVEECVARWVKGCCMWLANAYNLAKFR